MTDDHVLAMPVTRFWAMERQIHRIKAEKDLRYLSFDSAKNDKDSYRKVLDNLTLELGDTYQVERPKFVKPQSDLTNKFRNLK